MITDKEYCCAKERVILPVSSLRVSCVGTAAAPPEAAVAAAVQLVNSISG